MKSGRVVGAIKWAGSGIDEVVYLWFINNVPLGETIVEFGGGDVSTPALSEKYNLYTVEDNIEWVGKYKKTKYIYAPIRRCWYDVDCLRTRLPSAARAVLVDGPSGKRSGLFVNIDTVVNMHPEWIVFHDTNRPEETVLAYAVACRMGCPELKYYSEPNTQAYWAVVHDTSVR